MEQSFNGEDKSIKKSTVPFFETHGRRQRINNKPIHVGCKIWVLAEQYGYVIQFDSCHGAKSGKQIASKTRSELGEMVFLCLMNNLPRVHGQLFYFISVTSACWGV